MNGNVFGIVTPIIRYHGHRSSYGIISAETAIRIGAAILIALLMCWIVVVIAKRCKWFAKLDIWFIPKAVFVGLLLGIILSIITIQIAQ